MNFNKFLTLVLCATILFSCGPRKSKNTADFTNVPVKENLSGSFSVSGAFALYPLVTKWANEFMALNPGVKIEVIQNGTGLGVADLISGKAKLAMISRPLNDEEKQAGIWVVPVAKDGVAPIVNTNNPYLKGILIHGLTVDKLQKVFTGNKDMNWGELLDTTAKDQVKIYSRADESGAADIFASFLFRKAIDMKGTKVVGDEEMISSVQKDPMALGFCNVSYAFQIADGAAQKGIQIVPIDLDFDREIDRKEIPFNNLNAAHRSIWLGIYPESLCRELTLGSQGKPTDPTVVAFIKYVLNDGQKLVWTMGLCQLNNVYVRTYLESLN
jgi:phosphate transport system substrate-binding protein